ncbi:MAG: hypothetical protein IT381_08915 [Deltaproteobacteria bacterium]|nr:hypothetical protein [Deltaproteobacteria bacterium]
MRSLIIALALTFALSTLTAPGSAAAAKAKKKDTKKPPKNKHLGKMKLDPDEPASLPTSATHVQAEPTSQPIEATPAETPGQTPQQIETVEPTPASDGKRSPAGFGFNAKVGVLVPFKGFGPTIVAGGELRERFPFLKRMFGLALEFDYFEPRARGTAAAPGITGDFAYSASLRGFQMSADVLFFLPLAIPIDIYVGAGYSAFLYTVSLTAFLLTQTETQLRHGVRARLGVQWQFWGPLYIALEGTYHWVQYDFLITGTSNIGSFIGVFAAGFEI